MIAEMQASTKIARTPEAIRHSINVNAPTDFKLPSPCGLCKNVMLARRLAVGKAAAVEVENFTALSSRECPEPEQACPESPDVALASTVKASRFTVASGLQKSAPMRSRKGSGKKPLVPVQPLIIKRNFACAFTYFPDSSKHYAINLVHVNQTRHGCCPNLSRLTFDLKLRMPSGASQTATLVCHQDALTNQSDRPRKPAPDSPDKPRPENASAWPRRKSSQTRRPPRPRRARP